MPIPLDNRAYRRLQGIPESGIWPSGPWRRRSAKHGMRQSQPTMNSGSPRSKARQPIVSVWPLGTTTTRLASLARRAIGCQRKGSAPSLVVTTVASVTGVRTGRSPQRLKPLVGPVRGERH